MRLPGKVLADIEGQPMLQRVLARVRGAESIDETVVATSTSAGDDGVAKLSTALGFPCYRGSEDDVLDRYMGAARQFRANAIVRITADCPLIDPVIIDTVAEAFREVDADFASNTIERTFPRGLDVEIVRMSALEDAWKEAVLPYERSHVLPFVYEHPERFRLSNVRAPEDYSQLRWTVDTPEDLAFVRRVYEQLSDPLAGWLEVLQVTKRDPTLAEINRGVRQKDLSED